jgi:hypothetical protein
MVRHGEVKARYSEREKTTGPQTTAIESGRLKKKTSLVFRSRSGKTSYERPSLRLALALATTASLVIGMAALAGCGDDSKSPFVANPDPPVIEDRPADPGVSFQVSCPTGDFNASFIFSGGVPRDGIPSLDDPPFVSADKANFLRSDDRVIGIEVQGQARAYPIKIMTFHEIVNQCIGDTQTILTYCPLTNTALHYELDWPCGVSEDQRYGVSGLLYMGNLLMYDAPTEALWPQMYGDGATPSKGQTGMCLKRLYSVETSWDTWRKLHPSTLVLSPNNGFGRNYNYNPYLSFWNNPGEPWFVNDEIRRRLRKDLPFKTTVLGVIGETRKKAYLLPDGIYVINDTVGGIPLTLFSDGHSNSLFAFERNLNGTLLTFDLSYVREEDGLPIFKDRETLTEWTLDGIAIEGELAGKRLGLMPSYKAFWYAWSLFFPDTEVQTVPRPS